MCISSHKYTIYIHDTGKLQWVPIHVYTNVCVRIQVYCAASLNYISPCKYLTLISSQILSPYRCVLVDDNLLLRQVSEGSSLMDSSIPLHYSSQLLLMLCPKPTQLPEERIYLWEYTASSPWWTKHIHPKTFNTQKSSLRNTDLVVCPVLLDLTYMKDLWEIKKIGEGNKQRP